MLAVYTHTGSVSMPSGGKVLALETGGQTLLYTLSPGMPRVKGASQRPRHLKRSAINAEMVV